MRRRRTLGALLGALLWLPAPSRAVDGVVELNQTRAVSGGVFAEDAPGFPITISKPGSYRLTSNLIVPNAFTDAIAVDASDVTIDLNGFAIVGPASCSEPPVVCVPTGVGLGVVAGLETENVVVVNGVVRGMGSAGLLLHDRARVERVRAVSNGLDGIQVGEASAIVHCMAWQNRRDGIRTGRDSEVVGCVARLNGASGIHTGDGSRIAASAATANGGAGIEVGSGSTAVGNAAWANGDLGLNAGGGSGYLHNVLTANNGGDSQPQVSPLGLPLGDNVCGTALCP